MRDALNKTGRAIYYSICEWGSEKPWEWGKDVGNSWRTTGDISDSWTSFLSILDQQVGLEKFNEVGAWNDPDMLEVGNGGMTNDEYQAHFGFWALLRSPLLLGWNFNKISKEHLAIVSNADIIAINQEVGGKQGRRAVKDGDKEIWYTNLDGHNFAVILFNRGPKDLNITLNFADVEFTYPGGNLRDIIRDENLGYQEGSYTTVVKSHSIEFFKLHVYCTEIMKFLGAC